MEKNNNKIKLPIPFLFVIAVLIIAYFCPREGKFRYSYLEGKPWKYGLLTASFDFPIYKPEAQIQKERDSLLTTYQPYYTVDLEVQNKAIKQFNNDATAQNISNEYIKYVKDKLEEVYKTGIISTEDFEKNSNTQTGQLLLIDVTNIAVSRTVSSFYTAKSAYEKIMTDKPSNLESQILSSLNINNYLNNNILYDSDTSKKSKRGTPEKKYRLHRE
ncbi:MAG: hypothetical protein ACLVKO_04345 [Dysgonomonas sp.]